MLELTPRQVSCSYGGDDSASMFTASITRGIGKWRWAARLLERQSGDRTFRNRAMARAAVTSTILPGAGIDRQGNALHASSDLRARQTTNPSVGRTGSPVSCCRKARREVGAMTNKGMQARACKQGQG